MQLQNNSLPRLKCEQVDSKTTDLRRIQRIDPNVDVVDRKQNVLSVDNDVINVAADRRRWRHERLKTRKKQVLVK